MLQKKLICCCFLVHFRYFLCFCFWIWNFQILLYILLPFNFFLPFTFLRFFIRLHHFLFAFPQTPSSHPPLLVPSVFPQPTNSHLKKKIPSPYRLSSSLLPNLVQKAPPLQTRARSASSSSLPLPPIVLRALKNKFLCLFVKQEEEEEKRNEPKKKINQKENKPIAARE